MAGSLSRTPPVFVEGFAEVLHRPHELDHPKPEPDFVVGRLGIESEVRGRLTLGEPPLVKEFLDQRRGRVGGADGCDHRAGEEEDEEARHGLLPRCLRDGR